MKSGALPSSIDGMVGDLITFLSAGIEARPKRS
jgi:hypothetical protein